jgi:hypothetical protein
VECVFAYKNESLKLLFKTNGENVEVIKDVWNPVKRDVLFMIQTCNDETLKTTNHMLRVQFDILEVLEKTILNDEQLPLFELWEYFYLFLFEINGSFLHILSVEIRGKMLQKETDLH